MRDFVFHYALPDAFINGQGISNVDSLLEVEQIVGRMKTVLEDVDLPSHASSLSVGWYSHRGQQHPSELTMGVSVLCANNYLSRVSRRVLHLGGRPDYVSVQDGGNTAEPHRIAQTFHTLEHILKPSTLEEGARLKGMMYSVDHEGPLFQGI